MSSDILAGLAAHLNPSFADRLLAAVDKAGHRLGYDDLCAAIGYECTPENKGILAMYSKGLEAVDVCDSPKGRSGFGRKGMKCAPGIQVSENDLEEAFMQSAHKRLTDLQNSGCFDFTIGIPVSTVCAMWNDARDRLLVKMALENKKLPGFRLTGSTVKLVPVAAAA